MKHDRLRETLRKVGGSFAGSVGRNLSSTEAQEVLCLLLEGEGTPAQVAAFFLAMRSKGATADELAGFAKASRARVVFPDLPPGAVVVATSRLGKIHAPPIGLAAACATAACGVPVLIQAAPHAEGAGLTLGDLWEGAIGSLTGEPAWVSEGLSRHGLACWAPTQCDQKGWGPLLQVEEEIGLRCLPDTVIKLLAPPNARLITAAMPGPVLGTAGDALALLGHSSGMIVQGLEGSIDPSVCGRTRGLFLEDGCKTPLRVDPEDFALQCPREASFSNGEPLQAAISLTLQTLMGVEGPAFNSTLLCVALILRLARKTRDLATGIGLAREVIESGRAHHAYESVQGSQS